MQAALALSPFSTPFLEKDQDHLAEIKTPVMLQGGTLDWGITPLLPNVYDQLAGPKYYLVLKNETHFGWTNLISLGKTTTECIGSGNVELMTDYSLAFFDRHLRSLQTAAVLDKKHERLESYQHK